MAETTTFVPDIPLSPTDAWQLDGEFSTEPTYPVTWDRTARERGLRNVSDGAVINPVSVRVQGVTTATPIRASRLNPLGFLATSRDRPAELHEKLIAMQQRLGLGTLLVPEFGAIRNMAIGQITPRRSRALRRIDYTITFEEQIVVDLLLVAAVADFDSQALGPAGFQDQGDVT